MARPPRLSAAEKLATVEKYFELQNTYKVADELGISQTSVGQRLRALGIVTRDNGGSLPAEHYNNMEDVKRLKADLRRRIKLEKDDPVRRYGNLGVPAAVLLETLQLYMELESTPKVAAKMGVTAQAVSGRLEAINVKMHGRGRRSAGVTFASINNMTDVEAIIVSLKEAAGLD